MSKCTFCRPCCCCSERAEQEKAARAERQAAIREQLAELADELKEAQAAAREAAKAAREVARENQGVLKQVAAAEGSIKQAEQEVEEVRPQHAVRAAVGNIVVWFKQEGTLTSQSTASLDICAQRGCCGVKQTYVPLLFCAVVWEAYLDCLKGYDMSAKIYMLWGNT
jgi:hypothetical protein